MAYLRSGFCTNSDASAAVCSWGNKLWTTLNSIWTTGSVDAICAIDLSGLSCASSVSYFSYLLFIFDVRSYLIYLPLWHSSRMLSMLTTKATSVPVPVLDTSRPAPLSSWVLSRATPWLPTSCLKQTELNQFSLRIFPCDRFRAQRARKDKKLVRRRVVSLWQLPLGCCRCTVSTSRVNKVWVLAVVDMFSIYFVRFLCDLQIEQIDSFEWFSISSLSIRCDSYLAACDRVDHRLAANRSAKFTGRYTCKSIDCYHSFIQLHCTGSSLLAVVVRVRTAPVELDGHVHTSPNLTLTY